MIKEEIIVKTKEEFYEVIYNLDFYFKTTVRGKLGSGITRRSKTYKITDYAAPVDTLVVNAFPRHMYYSTGEDNSADRELIVFPDGRTSKTNRHNCRDRLSSWKWDNSKDAINFLNSEIIDELGNEFSSAAYPGSQSIKVSYDVEVTVRLVEDQPEPTFEEDELVLVWDNDKDYAKLRYFKEHNTRLGCCFGCWDDGQTSMTSDGEYEYWKNCAKVCQKCGKEECECK